MSNVENNGNGIISDGPMNSVIDFFSTNVFIGTASLLFSFSLLFYSFIHPPKSVFSMKSLLFPCISILFNLIYFFITIIGQSYNNSPIPAISIIVNIIQLSFQNIPRIDNDTNNNSEQNRNETEKAPEFKKVETNLNNEKRKQSPTQNKIRTQRKPSFSNGCFPPKISSSNSSMNQESRPNYPIPIIKPDQIYSASFDEDLQRIHMGSQEIPKVVPKKTNPTNTSPQRVPREEAPSIRFQSTTGKPLEIFIPKVENRRNYQLNSFPAAHTPSPPPLIAAPSIPHSVRLSSPPPKKIKSQLSAGHPIQIPSANFCHETDLVISEVKRTLLSLRPEGLPEPINDSYIQNQLQIFMKEARIDRKHRDYHTRLGFRFKRLMKNLWVREANCSPVAAPQVLADAFTSHQESMEHLASSSRMIIGVEYINQNNIDVVVILGNPGCEIPLPDPLNPENVMKSITLDILKLAGKLSDRSPPPKIEVSHQLKDLLTSFNRKQKGVITPHELHQFLFEQKINSTWSYAFRSNINKVMENAIQYIVSTDAVAALQISTRVAVSVVKTTQKEVSVIMIAAT